MSSPSSPFSARAAWKSAARQQCEMVQLTGRATGAHQGHGAGAQAAGQCTHHSRLGLTGCPCFASSCSAQAQPYFALPCPALPRPTLWPKPPTRIAPPLVISWVVLGISAPRVLRDLCSRPAALRVRWTASSVAVNLVLACYTDSATRFPHAAVHKAPLGSKAQQAERTLSSRREKA